MKIFLALLLSAYQPNPGPNSVATSAIQAGAVTEPKLSSALSVPIQTAATSSLPTPDGKTRLERVTDKNGGLVYSNGAAWQNVGAAWPIYHLEDFGGAAGCSTSGCRTANNTAWTNLIAAIGTPAADFTATYHVQFGPGTYYFSGPLKFWFSLYVEGAADSFLRPTTTLQFPPNGDGLYIAYDSLDPTYFGGSSTVKNLQITQDQTLATWTASHSYATGSAIMPTNLRGWTGYVFVNLGSTATSGSTEPTWPSDLQNPSGQDGGTISDGGVTWTAKAFSGIDIRANNIDMDSVDVYQIYGNGILIYGDTTNSLADGNSFRNVSSSRNMSAGFLVLGQDANENKFYNTNALFNCTWGVLDKGFLGNSWYGHDSSYNGPSCSTNYYDDWQPSITPPVGTELVPTVPNGYAYISAGTGATGSTEPTWPTTLGATVTDGAITWTCRRKYSGGPLQLRGGTMVGLYEEDSGIKTINGGMIYGFGDGNSFDSTVSGTYWNGTNHHSTQGFDQGSSNASYNALVVVGDLPGDLELGQYRIVHKDNSVFVGVHTQYDTNGFMDWFSEAQGPGAGFMQMPFGNGSDGASGPVYYPNGIGIGNFGSGNTVKEYYHSGVPDSPSNGRQGDRVVARLGLYNPGGAGLFMKIADGTGRWEEAGWTSPAAGNLLEPLAEYGETDLHFLIDDARTQFNYIFGSPETLLSRKGSYTLTWVGGNTNLLTESVPQTTASDSDIAYDYSRRSRKTLQQVTSSSYGKFAANSAHSLPTAGAETLSVGFYEFQNSTTNYTLVGYQTTSGNAGWKIGVTSSNTLTFSAQNTSSAAFVSLTSSATVAVRQYHLAEVVFDTVNNVYQLWLDGALVASTSSTTGTLGTTTGDIGVGGLLTNSATLTQPTGGDLQFMELERETRALSGNEIADHAKQFVARLGSSSFGYAVNGTNITAHSGGGGVGSCTQLSAVGFSRVDTVAANSDSVCLPPCVVGFKTTVVNKGTHTLALYPPSGGHLWTGSGATDAGANTAQSVAVCGSGVCLETFLCTDGTQWITTP